MAWHDSMAYHCDKTCQDMALEWNDKARQGKARQTCMPITWQYFKYNVKFKFYQAVSGLTQA